MTTTKSIVASQAYLLRAGGTNQGFLARVYPDILGRPIDPAGAGWVKLLAAGASRAQVVRAIMASPEYAHTLAQGLVQRFLRRPFDGSDAGYAQLAQNGLTNEQVLARIVGSPEYLHAIAKEATFTVANGIVTGDLGALPRGGVTVTIVVIPRVAGAQVASARVGGADVDLDFGAPDNTAQVSVFAGVSSPKTLSM